jgi:asparagine synthase (glutamine-hydrolysing)
MQHLLRKALLDSVRHHQVADVPVGIFLSSGLDSTTIAALASEIGTELQTVTLGFHEYRGTGDDETPLAEEVAKRYGAKHQTKWVEKKDFQLELSNLLDAMDQPSIDGVNIYFVSKVCAETGLKAALSGLGGDELFGGYPSFKQIPRVQKILSPFRYFPAVGKMFRVVSAPVLKRFTSPKYAGLLEYGGSYGGAYLLRRGMFMPWELPEVLDGDMVREGWQELRTLLRLNNTVDGIGHERIKVSALEMCWYMRNQLLRDSDWASMAHSFEIRVPLIDIDLLRGLIPSLMGDSPPTKTDMACTPEKKLPKQVFQRQKTGFTVPIKTWLQYPEHINVDSERGLRSWSKFLYERQQ